MNVARSLVAVLMLGLAGCQPALQTSTAEYAVFGTTVSVSIRHTPNTQPEAVLAELDHLFQRLHRDWHPWAPGALMTLNQALQSGDWIEIPQDLAQLLIESQRLEQLSNGHFNAAIGQLVSLWGFHTSNYPITSPPPAPQAIEAIAETKPSTLDIEWSNPSANTNFIRTNHPALRLDFSAMAKGAAADLACDLLIARGFSDALVNLGGDVLVCGASDQPWRVAINDPRSGVIEVIEVSERLAVFTSGQYYRYRQFDGQRYAHILDPRTGQPIEHVLQATAIASDPILADAAATALVVAGPAIAPDLAQAMGLRQWMLVDEAGGRSPLGTD